MKSTDFPGVQQAADDAAIRAQKYYINIIKFNLIAGTLGSLIAVYNFEQVQPKVIVYIASLTSLITTLILTILVKYLRYEDLWYQARALAESVKTLTWRYATCSDNFELNLSQQEVQQKFNESLTSLAQLFSDLTKFMDIALLNRDAISNEMNRMRNCPWQDRLAIYIKHRIEDQIDWYMVKAKFNKTKRSRWLSAIIVTQILSVAACLWLIFYPTSAWNLVGLLTTVSASAIGWLQLKQHQALVQAYTTASVELTQIKSLSNSLSDEDSFSEFVLDSENAISREHTTWLAQRRK